MGKQYIPLSSSRDSLNEERISEEESERGSKDVRASRTVLVLCIITSILITIIVVLSVALSSAITKGKTLNSRTGLSLARSVERKIYLPTKYSSDNRTEADDAWESINPGYGVVAVDKKWAAERNLVDTIEFPGNSEQSMYVIEAYHAIHCLKNLRRHYIAILDGKERTWAIEHDFHCFDGLRQHVMCNSDDTLLHTTGHQDAGRGQTLLCKDWDALTDWAAEHTTCYRDHEPGIGGNPFEGCMNGDGLPVGSVLE